MSLAVDGPATEDTLQDLINRTFSGVVSLDYFHNLIHLGKLFFMSDRVTGSSAQRVYLIRTGSKSCHVRIFLNAGSATPTELIKGVTVVTTGVAETLFNYNLSSVNLVEATIYSGSTFSGGSVFRENQAGFGNTPGSATSGVMTSAIEYVIPPNTDIILRASPATSTDTVTIIELYEG